jgi:uncharacterized protein (TIGR03435 family)
MAPAITGDPRRIDFADVSLEGVLSRAYEVRPNQIVGAEWIHTERYNIVATVPADAPKGQVPAMLQNLLAERFGMKVRWETRDEKGYALVVDKGGPKLTKSAVPESEAALKRGTSFDGSGHFTWRAAAMDDLAVTLTMLLASPVVDKTGIHGVFDITLDAAPDSLPGLRFGTPHGDSPNPSIFAAIHGLGLNLESGKVPVKKLVVESAQKVPTAN